MALIQGWADREHRLVLMPDLTAGSCALAALAAFGFSDFPVRAYAVLSAWLLQLRRVQRSSIHLTRQINR